jgi:hypothetical protein
MNVAYTLVSCSAYSLTLKMEATCSSETLVDFLWTTWHISQEIEIFLELELICIKN